MHIDLIELKPHKTESRVWVSEVFQHAIRQFDGCLKSNTFPVFVVQGDEEYTRGIRGLNCELFSYLNDAGYSFGLIHVMDELYDHDLSIYNLDRCVLVFRNFFRPTGGAAPFLVDFVKSFFVPNRYSSCHRQYSGAKWLAYEFYLRFTHIFRKIDFMKRQYFPVLSRDKIHYFPLGYTDKFALSRTFDSPSMANRKYKWSFCGNSFKTDRKLMLRCLSNIEPNFVFEYQGFMDERSLSGEEYWKVLSQSIFVPCSLGNLNIDTYRLFEVLEARAIPIIMKSHAWQPYDYYTSLLGSHPMPTFSSWKDAKAFLLDLDMESTERLSMEVSEWYVDFKSNLQLKVWESLAQISADYLIPHDVDNLDSFC
ncbi:hypothetical protein C7271_00645 [filamentous cyanobacterium CCP5]|nr:hypothetical protein C7271_00645 [filamentous cyanobacterium CCP5]